MTPIKVWADGAASGRLGRQGRTGSRATSFAYLPDTPADLAVSLTMPVRLASWDWPHGLAPVFDMNLPEGALRERLRLSFAKATGAFDDLDLLAIVGRSQIGRLRYTAPDAALDEEAPFQSVDEILAQRRGGELYRYLLHRFAAVSGISGVQPKILIRDENAHAAHLERTSFKGATHIVKLWEAEFPELAANEFFCLRAAERCGLAVPRFRLADDGQALVIDRFDLRPDGTYCGFEDFAVLNGRNTHDKYRGSYETSIFKRFQQFTAPAEPAQLEALFTLLVLNCAVRNGDAHLKNFGVLYDAVDGPVRLAPVYDVVTTTAYLPQDALALTLCGTTRWPDAARLQRFGETLNFGGPAVVRAVLAKVAEALAATLPELGAHVRDRPAFREVAARMEIAWREGLSLSLASGT